MPLPQQDEFGVFLVGELGWHEVESQCRFRSKMNSEKREQKNSSILTLGAVSMPLPQQDEFGVNQFQLPSNVSDVSMPLPQQDEFGDIKAVDEIEARVKSQCRFRSKMNSELNK